MKRRRMMKRRERTSTAAWLAGATLVAGATALLVTMVPSARRYLRLRAM